MGHRTGGFGKRKRSSRLGGGLDHRGNVTEASTQGNGRKEMAEKEIRLSIHPTCCLTTAFQPPRKMLIFLYCSCFLNVPQPFQLCPCWLRAFLKQTNKKSASSCAFGMKMDTNARYLERAELKEPPACSLEKSIHSSSPPYKEMHVFS